MKLNFKKEENGEINIAVEGTEFSTADYIEIIKNLKDGNRIEVDFEGDVSEEEKDSINSMIEEINKITEEGLA
ncbi:hypothetical protein KY334_06310 [Candidatus Woesearchaeota archaeon]|nr:hypothetical protein [Candidatus Woesearchaeota archaeon]